MTNLSELKKVERTSKEIKEAVALLSLSSDDTDVKRGINEMKWLPSDVVASFLEAARKKLKEDMQKLKSSWEENCVGEEDSGDLPDLEAFAHDLIEFINKYEHSAVFGGERK